MIDPCYIILATIASLLLHSVQILIKVAGRQKEGINVTEAGERVYRALLRVSGEVICKGRGRWRGRWFTVGNME